MSKMPYKKPSKEKMLELIEKSGGIILPIAQSLDCARRTVYGWIKEDEELVEALKDARESTIDIVESGYLKKAIEGNERAQEFLLRTLGKNRGYAERKEIETIGETSVNLRPLTPEEIEILRGIK